MKSYIIVISFAILLLLSSSSMCVILAFSSKDLFLINVGIPSLTTIVKAVQKDIPIMPALFRSIIGGCIIANALKNTKNAEEKSNKDLWKTKLQLNLGSSLVESATCNNFTFKMDIGPWWIIFDNYKISTKIGIHSAVVTLLNRLEGSKPSFKYSLKYGTIVFKKPKNFDGTIGKRGALAYSNANNITLNPAGQHAGHELIHAYQYRRDNAFMPNIGSIIPNLNSKISDTFYDDTAWLLNWTLQIGYAQAAGINKDFGILLEKEAYFLADDISF